jgi:hypothetical protein
MLSWDRFWMTCLMTVMEHHWVRNGGRRGVVGMDGSAWVTEFARRYFLAVTGDHLMTLGPLEGFYYSTALALFWSIHDDPEYSGSGLLFRWGTRVKIILHGVGLGLMLCSGFLLKGDFEKYLHAVIPGNKILATRVGLIKSYNWVRYYSME